jgi:lipopolysaccharide/colanic/teichoic acid biosynthesis glycosyltransferase
MKIKIKKIMHEELNISGSCFFWAWKRIFDLSISILLIPLMLIFVVFLFFINPFFNPGSIFFVQTRMGKDCKPFRTFKFRTMVPQDNIERKYNDPLELDRITYLGKLLRKFRVDEIPQILNVIIGDMSLIGPRPDYYEHALYFLDNVDNYSLRHSIRPGLSGLSQIRLGYAEGINATKEKASVDLFYIKNAGFILDAKIFFGTIYIIFCASGG